MCHQVPYTLYFCIILLNEYPRHVKYENYVSTYCLNQFKKLFVVKFSLFLSNVGYMTLNMLTCLKQIIYVGFVQLFGSLSPRHGATVGFR